MMENNEQKITELDAHVKLSIIYDTTPTEANKDPMDVIMLKVMDIQKVPVMIGKSRKGEKVFARQAFFWITKTYFKSRFSLTNIGNKVGKDHATVLHGIKTINNLRDTNRYIKERIDMLYKACVDKLEEEEIKKICMHNNMTETRGILKRCPECGVSHFYAETKEGGFSNNAHTSNNKVPIYASSYGVSGIKENFND